MTATRPAAAAGADPADVRAAGGWDGDPVPLTARRLLPPFPVDALPGWVADQVAAVAEFTQTPPDLPGCLALACLSAAAGGRAVVEVRPGWREPVNLFTAVAMPPGSRKSAVFATMTAPLLATEAELVDAARPAVVEADLAARVARARAEKAAKAAESAATPDARMSAFADASSVALAAEQVTVPVLPRLIADDITPEAAASLLAEQGGRLAVLSAEAGIFATLAGRYSGAPNLEVFLKGHAGDMLRVDRKGRPPEHIPAPALTLGLAVQPEVLVDIAHMPGFRGRGLLARILYALPANTVGRRRIGAPPPPAAVTATYAAGLGALVRDLADWTDPAVLALHPAADTRVLQLEAAIEPRLAGDLAHLADWASKLTGATVRVAGLLHLATHHAGGWNSPMSAATVDAAARIGHYYLAHALAVFDHMGADPLVDDARAVLDWIARTGPARFTRRDAFNETRGPRFRKVTDLDPALELLVEHGYLRSVPPPPATPGRPPSPAFDVHPRAQLAEPAQPRAGGAR
jgi:replicative DNA helicase